MKNKTKRKLRVIFRLGVVFALIAALSFALVPAHEYAHCAGGWLAGEDSACTVVYYHPIEKNPPTLMCEETTDGHLLCTKTIHNDTQFGVAYGGSKMPVEHYTIWRAEGMLLGFLIIIGTRWATRRERLNMRTLQ